MFKDDENGVGCQYLEKQKQCNSNYIGSTVYIGWDTKYVNKMLGTPKSNEELEEENSKKDESNPIESEVMSESEALMTSSFIRN